MGDGTLTDRPTLNLDGKALQWREVWRHVTMVAKFLDYSNREFLQQEKSSRFRLAKEQLCTCITLFCTFLCRHCCATTTWKCLIWRFVEDGNTRKQPSFSFPELWYSLFELGSKKFANIWRIKRAGVIAIKFEAARIHFLSDVFVAVAVFAA